jgi:hypothetical protein
MPDPRDESLSIDHKRSGENFSENAGGRAACPSYPSRRTIFIRPLFLIVIRLIVKLNRADCRVALRRIHAAGFFDPVVPLMQMPAIRSKKTTPVGPKWKKCRAGSSRVDCLYSRGFFPRPITRLSTFFKYRLRSFSRPKHSCTSHTDSLLTAAKSPAAYPVWLSS